MSGQSGSAEEANQHPAYKQEQPWTATTDEIACWSRWMVEEWQRGFEVIWHAWDLPHPHKAREGCGCLFLAHQSSITFGFFCWWHGFDRDLTGIWWASSDEWECWQCHLRPLFWLQFVNVNGWALALASFMQTLFSIIFPNHQYPHQSVKPTLASGFFRGKLNDFWMILGSAFAYWNRKNFHLK